jgi:uncharacterized damage-inducible protein DinB
MGRSLVNTWSNIFRQHRWANQSLINALSQLSEEELALSVAGTYGDSFATIRHMISSNADYVRIIPDAPRVTQIGEDGPFPGWEVLKAVAWETDSALIDYVAGVDDDLFFVDIDDGQEFELTRSMLLCQIIHHATEHRSQIRTTLSAHGITPPEISTWAWRLSDDGRGVLQQSKPST